MRSRYIIITLLFSFFFSVSTGFAFHEGSEFRETVSKIDHALSCHDTSLVWVGCTALVGVVYMDDKKAVPFQLDVPDSVMATYLGLDDLGTGDESPFTGQYLIMGHSHTNQFEGTEYDPTKLFFTQDDIDYVLPVTDKRSADYYKKYHRPLAREIKKVMSYVRINEDGEYVYKSDLAETKVNAFVSKYERLVQRVKRIKTPWSDQAFNDKDAALLYKLHVYGLIVADLGFME